MAHGHGIPVKVEVMGKSRRVEDDDPRIVATTFDRMRLGIFIQLVGICLGLFSSEAMGIPLPAPILGLNLLALACTLGALAAFHRRWIPSGNVHAVVALVWILAPITTLSSLVVTEAPNLVFPLVIEIALAAVVQVSWRYFVATTASVVIAYAALAFRHPHPDTLIHVASVAGVTVCLWLLQRQLRRSMNAAILREDVHAATAASLERELVERSRAEDQRRIADELRQCAEEERERLRDQFVHAQRMDAVGTLAAGLAHDMNNIIGGILGVAQIGEEETTDPASRADFAAIASQAMRAGELTRSLLAYSRRGQYRRAPVGIDTVVDEVEPLLARMFGNQVSVERRGGADAVVDADAAQLGQALVNLCINGADAMERHGQLTLSTGVARMDQAAATRLSIAPGPFAMISVRDEGCGMTPAIQKQIFEPFFTTKEIGKGTGLGLAMVWGTVQGHGGAIEVRSSPGAGTTFTLFLPIINEVAIARSVPATRESGRLRGPMKLALVVDDEPAIRAVATRTLRQMGLSVIGAGDGAEALDVFDARRDEISVVVLDMAMPVMGGADCFRELRKRSGVPIMIASGYANEIETQGLLALGNAAFLEKPFSVDALRRHVERMLVLR